MIIYMYVQIQMALEWDKVQNLPCAHVQKHTAGWWSDHSSRAQMEYHKRGTFSPFHPEHSQSNYQAWQQGKLRPQKTSSCDSREEVNIYLKRRGHPTPGRNMDCSSVLQKVAEFVNIVLCARRGSLIGHCVVSFPVILACTSNMNDSSQINSVSSRVKWSYLFVTLMSSYYSLVLLCILLEYEYDSYSSMHNMHNLPIIVL